MDIDEIRKRIDLLDDVLLRIFNERARLALEIGNLKKGFDIHQSTGADRTIIGVIGDTESLNEREIEALPGVSQVVRIRKDD